MYLDFYALSHAPFHITPDPAFFFLSPSHKEALGAIAYGIASRQGLVAIVGETGVGKTTLLRAYLAHVNQHELKTIFVFNTPLAFDDLLRLICRDLGLTVTTNDPLTLGCQLQQALNEETRQGRNVALIIDEAQAMPIETLAQLRLLSTLEDATGHPLQIVLVGQPELHHTLHQDALRHLEQRLVVRSTVLPLTSQESLAYIHHRLAKVTQDTHAIFTAAALRRIVRHAKGVPRVLNILCTNAFIAGFAAQQKPITAALVTHVIAEVRGTRRLPVWQLGLASSAALALLAGFLWLAPWQGRPKAAAMLPQPPSAQAGDRTAKAVAQTAAPAVPRPVPATEVTPGIQVPHHPTLTTAQSEASGAAAAQQQHARATSEEAAKASDTQEMRKLPTPLETPRSPSGAPGDTQALDKLRMREEPRDSIPLPPAPRLQTARKRAAGSVPRAAARAAASRGAPSVASAADAPPRRRHRAQLAAGRGTSHETSLPQRSDPVPRSPAAAWPFFDAQTPTNDDDGG